MKNTIYYLYKIQPIRSEMLTESPTEDEQNLISQHFDYLKNLTDQGVVLLAGRTLNTDETSFGIVIFIAESEEAATEIMNNDPAVKHKVMRAELYPYGLALMGKSPFQN